VALLQMLIYGSGIFFKFFKHDLGCVSGNNFGSAIKGKLNKPMLS
jgi:hypothetical protein